MSLTVKEVKAAKPKDKPYKLTDAKSLYLRVMTTGAKYWQAKYRFADKEKVLSLGVFPEISLSDARELWGDARKQIRNGVDPNAVKKIAKACRSETGYNSFEVIAREWFKKKVEGKSEGHASRNLRIIENDLIPPLGSLPINDITPPLLLSALHKIEDRGAYYTAGRALSIYGQINRYAVVTSRTDRDISPDLRGALITPEEEHFSAITEPDRVSDLMAAIPSYIGSPSVKAALEISPYLFQRPGEIRHMEWAEIKWKEERWEIPKEKMKLKREHIVPLCKQALAILKKQQHLTGGGQYVFTSFRGKGRPISDNTVRSAILSLGFSKEEMCPHGFRAMARTIMDEVLNMRVDLIEHQLSHVVKDANGRAYNRTAHLPARAIMMQTWADYLNAIAANGSGDIDLTPFKKIN